MKKTRPTKRRCLILAEKVTQSIDHIGNELFQMIMLGLNRNIYNLYNVWSSSPNMYHPGRIKGLHQDNYRKNLKT